MYKDYLTLKPCKFGQGVFTTVEIPANVPILEVSGDLYAENKLPDPSHPALLQVGPDTFIGPSGDIDDYINHSCRPNCLMHIVGNRAILYSMYVIPANTELTFDYSTSSTDTMDKWHMLCVCGDFNCRKVISGFQYLDPDLQNKMWRKGMVPQFMLDPNMFQKRW